MQSLRASRCSGAVAAAVAVAAVATAAMADGGRTADAGSSWPQQGDGGWALQAGGIVVMAPTFEGSKRYAVKGAPFIAPAGLGNGSDGLLQFKGLDDVRLRLLNWHGLEAGPLIGYRQGREDDQRHLHGLGDIDGGLVGGGFVGYRMGPLMPFVSYHHQLTGDDTGGLVRFGLEAKGKPAAWLTLTAMAGANWMSSDYSDAFFSVTPLQSRASGHAVYDADAGIKDAFLGLTGDVALDRQWSLKLIGRYSHLTGEAADSPIVESESQLFGGIGLTYRFSVGSK